MKKCNFLHKNKLDVDTSRLRQQSSFWCSIYKISYDNLMIHLTMNGKLFIGEIHVQNRNIVVDSVRKLAYDNPERNFSTF